MVHFPREDLEFLCSADRPFPAARRTSAVGKADTIYLHGDILTVAHLRPSDTSSTPARITAVAISQGRVLAIGNHAEMLKLKGATTRVIDLNGVFAMPGCGKWDT